MGTAATTEMSTATAADVAATTAAVATTALGEARGCDRKNQCQRCGSAQNSQTSHVQTPFPESKPTERAVVPGFTPVCA
jgi:hypothetical protein